MLFHTIAFSRPVGLRSGDVIVWYQSLFSMLSLDGSDKWSLDRGFEKEMVPGGLISDLRMFLSVSGLLDHVTKLRRCSSIIKLQPVCYMAIGRERTPHQKCWSHRIC
jgi:hypothetical protein